MTKGKLFTSTYKVYFANTDAAGVVHHSEYIRWLEASRIDFLDTIGCPYKALQDQKIGFSPIHIDIQYLFPLRYGDTAIINSKFSMLKKASLAISSEIYNQEGQQCTQSIIKLACLDEANWKITKVPQILIEAVANFESH